MQEFGIPPLKLQQAMQLVSMYIRYSVTHTHLPAAHLYHLRRALICALSQPQNSVESPIKEACHELRLPETYLDHPPYPPQCEPKSEIKASPTPLGSNPRSTTYGTSSSAPQSQHMLALSTTQTFPSVQLQGLPGGCPDVFCGEGGSPNNSGDKLPVPPDTGGSLAVAKLPAPPDTLAFHSAERPICECSTVAKWCARSVEGGCRFMLAYG